MKVEDDLCLRVDEKAEHSLDWESLRYRSLEPGGFGDRRTELWPQLLGVRPGETATIRTDAEAHRDERQIRLDTARSFVLYPADLRPQDKETLQEELQDLLVSVFRKRPRLNYFQGYHDIVSVLFLTLEPDMQLICAEKLSLHRVRDSMGVTLEPVLGLLRVTKNLLHLADPDFAASLESTSPLPFYALSNLLTLFSHDMPTLPLIQHVFDYILCRPPIIIVYLATTIILSRRAEIQRLEEGDDDDGMGMAHSVLSTLPPIIDGEGTGISIGAFATTQDYVDMKDEDPETPAVKDANLHTPAEVPPSVIQDGDHLHPINTTPEPPAIPERIKVEEDPEEHLRETPSRLPTRPPTPLVRPETPSPHSQPPVPLTTLLAQADALHALYPPSHPSLYLSSIMGPQSVIFTWSESFTALPDDDEAEAMVAHPELVVYPYIDEPEADEEEGEDEGSSSMDEKRKGGRRRLGLNKSRLQSLRRRFRAEGRTGTMVAGAVLVLGIAMAVYGIRMRGTHLGGGIYGLGPGGMDGIWGRAGGPDNVEWRKMVGWFGGAVAGTAERLLSGSEG